MTGMKKESAINNKLAVKAAVNDVAMGLMTVYAAAKKHGVDRTSISRVFLFREKTVEDEPMIRLLYPTTDTAELAAMLQCTVSALQKRASLLGVPKCPQFLSQQQSKIIRGADYGFKAGGIPLIKSDPVARANYEEGVRRNIQAVKNKKYISEIEKIAKTLDAAGHSALAQLTELAAQQMIAAKGRLKFDFLTVCGGWE